MTVLEKLLPFLQVKVYEKPSEDEELTFDLIDATTDEVIGYYSLDEKGELASFTLIEDPTHGHLAKEEILTKANTFVNTFYPNQKEFELSAVLDLDNPYMVVYEKRDEKYGLFLHSTGFTVSVSTSGEIMRFYRSDEEYEVTYSEMIVSKEEALQAYLDKLDFEICIQRFDRDIFANGDDQYHLAYREAEYITDIPIDGREASSIREEHDLGAFITEQDFSEESLYELIGITAEYKLVETQLEDGKRIEVWSTDDLDKSSFDMDEQVNHASKLCFDEQTGKLLQVINGEQHDDSVGEIGLESAQEKAVRLIGMLYPNSHEKFRKEVLDDSDDYEEFEEVEDSYDEEERMVDVDDSEEEWEDTDWDDEYMIQEPTYTFYFHLHHMGYRVDQHVSVIGIGKYTGRVVHCLLDVPTEEQFKEVVLSPAISIEEAKGIFKKAVKMELMFTREYDEDGRSIYSLSYVPEFPETIGHIRSIDAITGKAMYADIGDAMILG